jgi:hypothetical protein
MSVRRGPTHFLVQEGSSKQNDKKSQNQTKTKFELKLFFNVETDEVDVEQQQQVVYKIFVAKDFSCFFAQRLKSS